MTTAADERRRLLEMVLERRGLAAGEEVRPRAGDGPAPLSPAQERLWFLARLYPGSPMYNVHGAIRFTGPLDVAALQDALATVVDRHEALRTRFALDGDAPTQVVEPDARVLLAVETVADPEPRMAALAAEPFDLERAPLLRAAVLRVADDEHVLVLVVHHIVCDGWSLGLITRELTDLYNGGPDAALEPVALQVADVAVWQRTRADEGVEWWRERLAGAPPHLELPIDRPRPAQRTFAGATDHFSFAVDMTSITATLNATPFMVMLAAWVAVLHRASGAGDIVVGTPVAGRTRSELEGVVGLLVNTLSLRVDCSGDPSFGELVERVRAVTLDALARQDVPFERIVEAVAPPRDPGTSPVYQAIFALQNAPEARLDLAGTDVEYLPVDSGTARLDLALDLIETGDGIAAQLNYSTELFEPATAQGYGEAFVAALEAGVEAPATPLSRLALGRPTPLLAGGAAHAGPPVPDLVAAQPADRTALRAADGATVTYGELRERAEALAVELHAAGAGPEAVVGIALERGPEMVVAQLATWLTGAAFLSLDPEQPAARIQALLDQAQAVAAVDAGGLRKLGGRSGDGGPGRLAYLIATSGSTGTPKLVAVEHAPLANVCVWYAGEYALRPGDRCTVLMAPGFDAVLLELWAPLAAGAEVAFVPADVRADPPRLARWLGEQRVDVSIMPAVLADAVVREPLPHLRTLVSGGERPRATPPPGLHVVNAYGPTEAAIASTVGTPPAIGTPIAGLRAYVLDDRLEPVVAGFPGELVLGGAGLARGYVGRPGATAAAFVPDPYAPAPGARMYRTGDRVRLRPDGTLEFLGRGDAQLKVRGVRIEPAEVEAALATHPAVTDAAVTALGEGAGRVLAALVVTGAPPDPVELRAFLSERLPAALVPGVLLFRDEPLPKAATGKLDRARVAAEAQAAAKLAPAGPARAGTATEEAVAAIWASVLDREGIGARDDFFALGGQSLLATQVASRVQRTFGVDVPLRALFEAPTVEGYARAIDRALTGQASAGPPPVPCPRDAAPQLSFAQQRLWFLDQMEPANPAYNLPLVVRLTGELDRAALTGALQGLVERHEALRTTFTTERGEPRQLIAPELPLVPSIIEARPDEARQIIAEESARPFDLAAGPLIRATLVALGAREHVLVLCTHHIVSDGWSLGVLTREFSELYSAAVEGREPALEPLPIQYADFAVWQRERLQGEQLARHLQWWKDALDGAPPAIDLPTDRPRPAIVTNDGATYRFSVPPALTTRLHELATANQATPFMVLLAAVAALLHRSTDATEIVVGAPIANRNRSEIEGLIGFFVNTLVLRVDCSGDPTFLELVARVRDFALGAYAHQDLPFEKLVESVKAPRNLAVTPIFQVGFAMQNAPEPDLRLPGLEVEFLTPDDNSAKFDFSIDFYDTGEGLAVAANYRTELFDDEAIEALCGRLLELLAGALDNPPLSRLPVLPAAERERVLTAFNRTAAVDEELLAERVARHARQTPDAPAIRAGAETITYAELDACTDALARRLLDAGLRPEEPVAVLVERGADVILALLGIWKAGGAYLPLDPGHPAQRIALVLEDAAPRLAVATGELPAGIEVIAPRQSGDGAPVMRATPGSLSHVIYTSGSTGTPKGVLVEHRGLPHLAAAQAEDFAVTADDRVLGVASPAFDAHLWDIVMALHHGATLVLATGAALLPGPELFELMRDERVTIATLTPAAAAALPSTELDDLRVLVLAADVVPGELAQRWALDHRVFNGYGPTEATIAATWHEVEYVGTAFHAPPPIGRALPNYAAYVLDERLEPVAPGVPGELYVGGVGVARGYLHRCALTAERFLPDPFAPAPGARMYRTGDRAKLMRDGALEFLGRADEQVKVRGFRVEPGEIEAVLRGHRAVRDVAVVARGQDAAKRLVAYVVPDGDMPDTSELRMHTGAALPDFMVPATFVELDALPLSANGKLDRDALPEPAAARPELQSAFTPPRDPTEEKLARIWCELLGVERVGIFDGFFDLGGDSLLAIQMVARANEAGVPLTAKDFFQAQTIYDISMLGNATAFVAPEQGAVSGPLPLTPIQHWLLDGPGAAPNHFNQALLLEAGTGTDPELARQALAALLDHHDGLRARFARGADGAWRARLEEPGEPPAFERIAIEPGDDATLLAHAERLQTTLDLERGPLVRAAWFDYGDAESALLLLVVHHLIVDAVSWSVVLEDLADFYEQLAEGRELSYPAKTTSVKWWASRLAEYAQSPLLRRELDYWLATVPAEMPALPVDRDDGPPTFAAAHTLSTHIEGVPHQQDALLAALALAVAEWTGHDGTLVELEGHGREELFDGANLFATVGWFTTLYPVLLPVAASTPAPDALAAVRDTLAAVPTKGIGYGVLRWMSDLGDRLAARAAPQIGFNSFGRMGASLDTGGGGPFRVLQTGAGTTIDPEFVRPHLLTITASATGERVHVQWTYSTRHHDEATIALLASTFERRLKELR